MNPLSTLALCGGLLAAAAPALAQGSQVFPSDHTTVEGSTFDSNFGPSNGVNRTQVIFDRRDLQVPNGAQITRVGFRPDKDANEMGAAIQMEILMGHTDHVPASTTSGSRVESTFSQNYTAPPVSVFTLKIVNLPTLMPSSPGPSGQRVMFDLDTPFTYDASQNLVVEFQIRANNNGNSRFNYRFDQATVFSPTSTFGSSCQTSNGNTPSLTAGAAQIAGNWNVRVSSSLPNAPGVLFFGDTEVDVPFGPSAPGCSLYVLPIAIVNQGTTSSGSFSLNVPIPRIPELYGMEYSVQHLIFDVFANNAGFVASNRASTVFGRLPQMAYVERINSYTSTTGSVRRETGPVMFLDWN